MMKYSNAYFVKNIQKEFLVLFFKFEVHGHNHINITGKNSTILFVYYFHTIYIPRIINSYIHIGRKKKITRNKTHGLMSLGQMAN